MSILYNVGDDQYQIGEPFKDKNGRFWRELCRWTDNGWQFVTSMSVSNPLVREYYDADTVDALKQKARRMSGKS